MARRVLGVLSLVALLGVVWIGRLAAQPQSTAPARPFNGITTGTGDLHRLSKAKTRSISPENFTGEKGQRRHGHRGDRRQRRPRSRPGLEGLALGEDQAGAGVHARRDQRVRRDSAHLDDTDRQLALLDHPFLLGRRDTPSVEAPVGDFFASGWGQLCPDQLARRLRQPGERLQLLLGDAVPQVGAGSRWRTSPRRR